MIDSPVGKTADAAVAGTLTLMVGGPADVVARCRPVLDCMGTDFFHCGELGAGQTMKLINNLLATAVSEASIEALVTGTKSGLTLDTMMSVFRTTMAWNNALAIAMPKRPLAGDFTPGFMMKLAHKDCRLALKMVDALGVAAPVGHAAFASLEEGMRRGLADDDVGALLKLREEPAGVQVRLANAMSGGRRRRARRPGGTRSSCIPMTTSRSPCTTCSAGETVDVRRAGRHRSADGDARPFRSATSSRCAPSRTGAPVRKYGECIGVATADIAPGSHVHVHNMESRRARKTT